MRSSLPPSALQIYKVLKKKHMVTAKDLLQEVPYSPRTVRYAVKILVERGLVKRVPVLGDTRQFMYILVLNR